MTANNLKLILASTSQFRQKLLRDAGVTFEAMASVGDEKSIGGLAPRILARHRAEFKATDVANRAQPGSVIIGADQVLSLDGVAYDKAETAEEAVQRLLIFQGRTHYLHSAFCLMLVHKSGSFELIHEEVVDVPMKMRRLSKDEIYAYVATEEWRGCVGCYRAEGQGIGLFEAMGGDHTAIIGLPLMPLFAALRRIPLN